MKSSLNKRSVRHYRIRHKMGKSNLPRFSVFRSNNHIYAQIIDDIKSSTVASYSDLNLKEKSEKGKLEQAFEVGLALAKSALAKKIQKVKFDRGGYKYHGRVKSMAEGARKGGLIF